MSAVIDRSRDVIFGNNVGEKEEGSPRPGKYSDVPALVGHLPSSIIPPSDVNETGIEIQ